jgi:DNA-binding protein H-NS
MSSVTVTISPTLDTIASLSELKRAKAMLAAQMDRVQARMIEVGKAEIARITQECGLQEAAGQMALALPTTNGKRRNGNGKHTTRAKTKPMKAKFWNPANHDQTWSGHGKRPNWFKAAVGKGVKPEEMRAH